MKGETIVPGELTLAQLRRLSGSRRVPVSLASSCRAGIRASSELVQRAAEGEAPVYGVNTGFGKLATTRIARDDLAVLQLKLLRSHAVGVGEPLDERVVRLVLLLKAASLARGYSGVRMEVIDALIAMHNLGLTPVIPCQGSVGASGDLAPLAHLSLPLIGEGEVFLHGERMPAAQALERVGLKPITLSGSWATNAAMRRRARPTATVSPGFTLSRVSSRSSTHAVPGAGISRAMRSAPNNASASRTSPRSG